MEYNALSFFYAVWGMMAILMVVILGVFIFDAFARYKYLKVLGYERSWLAFIPIANIFATVEATYGKQEKINIYGWKAPAIILKLWGVAVAVAILVLGRIPFLGRLIVLAMQIVNIAVIVQLYRDMMERLYCPQDVAESVIAVIIRFVSSIKVISTAKKYDAGEIDYRKEERELSSQKTSDGLLSFMNGR